MKRKLLKVNLIIIVILFIAVLYFSPSTVLAFSMDHFTPRFTYTASEEDNLNEKLKSSELNDVIPMLYQQSSTYYYDTLDSIGKKFYDELLLKVKNYNFDNTLISIEGDTRKYQVFELSATIPNSIIPNQALKKLQNGFRCMLDDHKEYFYFSGFSSYKSTYYPNGTNYVYNFTVYASIYDQYVTGDRYNYTLLRDAKELINNVYNITKTVRNLPLLVKIRYFHDWLVTNNSYNVTFNTPLQHSPISALSSYYLPVCEGYAEALSILFNASGINGIYAVGTATNSSNNSENHAWNYVFINNKLYMIDTTWDDPTSNNPNYLKDWDAFYKYFLIKTPDKRRLFVDKDNNIMAEYNENLKNFITAYCTENFYHIGNKDYSFSKKPEVFFETNGEAISLYKNINIVNFSSLHANIKVLAYNTVTGEAKHITNLQNVTLEPSEYLILLEFKEKSVQRTVGSYTISLSNNAKLYLTLANSSVCLTSGESNSSLTKKADDANIGFGPYEVSTKSMLEFLNRKINDVDKLSGFKAVEFRLRNKPNTKITQEEINLLKTGNYDLIVLYSKIYNFVFKPQVVYLYDLTTQCSKQIFVDSDEFIINNVATDEVSFNKLSNKVEDFLKNKNFTIYQLYFVYNKTILDQSTLINYASDNPTIEFGLILDFEFIININNKEYRFSRNTTQSALLQQIASLNNENDKIITNFVELNTTTLDLSDKERNINIKPNYLNLKEEIFSVDSNFQYEFKDNSHNLVYNGKEKRTVEKITQSLTSAFAKKGITVSNVVVTQEDDKGQPLAVKCSLVGENFLERDIVFSLNDRINSKLNLPLWVWIVIGISGAFLFFLTIGISIAKASRRRRN